MLCINESKKIQIRKSSLQNWIVKLLNITEMTALSCIKVLISFLILCSLPIRLLSLVYWERCGSVVKYIAYYMSLDPSHCSMFFLWLLSIEMFTWNYISEVAWCSGLEYCSCVTTLLSILNMKPWRALWCTACCKRKWHWRLRVRVNYKVYHWENIDRELQVIWNVLLDDFLIVVCCWSSDHTWLNLPLRIISILQSQWQ